MANHPGMAGRYVTASWWVSTAAEGEGELPEGVSIDAAGETELVETDVVVETVEEV